MTRAASVTPAPPSAPLQQHWRMQQYRRAPVVGAGTGSTDRAGVPDLAPNFSRRFRVVLLGDGVLAVKAARSRRSESAPKSRW